MKVMVMDRLDLPEVWDYKKLGQICDISIGKTPRRNIDKYWGGKNRWVSIADLNDGILVDTKECITDIGVRECNVKLVKAGTVLMSFKLTIGKLAITGGDMYTNEAIVALPIKEGIDVAPRFLFYSLKMATVKKGAEEASKGLTLNKGKLSLIQVPIPPLPEQHRLLSRIEKQTVRALEIKNKLAEAEKDFNEALHGVYADITKNAEYLPMSEVAPLVRRAIRIDLTQKYPELGIRSFGKGTFHKPALTGKELGSKRIFRIEEGDLLFNIVFAWEGAVTVARPEDHGRVGSHRFLTCVPKKGIAISPFLCFHFLTDQGIHDLGDASPGGAGRNRTLGLKALDRIEVPVPSYEKQVWFSALWEKVNQARKLQAEISVDLAAYTPALLAKAFRGEL